MGWQLLFKFKLEELEAQPARLQVMNEMNE